MQRINLNIPAAVCVFVMTLAVPAVAVTRYVNPGESIQAAINAASNGDEIEVAPGTYYEAIIFYGRAVRLYSNGGPDVTTIDGTGYYNRVVKCISGEDTNTILEGFTITGGHGTSGGGMLNNESSPTISNCTFTSNSATEGGGMYNDQSSPTLTNCTFSGNSAEWGGGMYNWWFSSPTMTNCTFSGNSADVGGGIYNIAYCSFDVTNCVFTGNTAGYGGGVFNDTSRPTVTNCTFSGNSADIYGGGLENRYSGNPTVTNCLFIGNTAGVSGGGMATREYSRSTVSNCTFSGNRAYFGGGMCNYINSSSSLTNCTFIGNVADRYGGGGISGSGATLTNCILWGGMPDEIDINGSATVTYSDIQGGWAGEGNIDADPCFIDANGGNLRLSSDSPCIDTGYNNAPNLPATDLDGHPRIIDGDCNDTDVVDMGAYEFNYAYIGDFDYNCRVNFADLSTFGLAWTSQPGDFNWDFACDISTPADNVINKLDLAAFAYYWLLTIP